ncbi:MAG: tetratricopeptide repeat protein [bacterium]|nr:tetratricopeptide repeat protein [bacterium]
MTILLTLMFLLPPLPLVVESYESIDVVQDEMSLRIPLDMLKGPAIDIPEGARPALFEGLEREWFIRKQNLSIGDERVGDQMLGRIHESMLDLGVVRMRPYAASLLREARYHLDRGSGERAMVLSRAASRLAPGLPEPHFMMARILWQEKKSNIFSVILQWFEAGRAVVQDQAYRAALWPNLALVTLVAGALFFTLFYIAQMFRYFGLLVHDFRELLPGEPSEKLLIFASLFLVVAPIILGWGIYALGVFWLVLLWSYGTGKERFVHFLFLLFVLVTPWIFGWIHDSAMELYGEQGAIRVLHRDGISDNHTVARLERLLEADPTDDEVLFMLGTAYKKRGDYEGAEKALTEAIGINPKVGAYYNNLANTYYALRDLDKAVENYEEAIVRDPQDGSFHYNLSAALRELLKLNESDKEYFVAKELAPAKVSYYANILGPSYNRMVIDTPLPRVPVWRNLLPISRFDLRNKLAGPQALRGFVEHGLRPFLLIIFVVAAHYLRRLAGTARECQKCGAVYCKRCQSEIRREAICSKCVHLFEDQAAVDVKQRTRKIIEIRKHRETSAGRGRLLGIILPGGGHIYRGWVGVGFLVVFSIVGLLIYGFFPELLVSPSAGFPLMPQYVHSWVLLPVVIIYVLSLFHLDRVRP